MIGEQVCPHFVCYKIRQHHFAHRNGSLVPSFKLFPRTSELFGKQFLQGTYSLHKSNWQSGSEILVVLHITESADLFKHFVADSKILLFERVEISFTLMTQGVIYFSISALISSRLIISGLRRSSLPANLLLAFSAKDHSNGFSLNTSWWLKNSLWLFSAQNRQRKSFSTKTCLKSLDAASG